MFSIHSFSSVVNLWERCFGFSLEELLLNTKCSLLGLGIFFYKNFIGSNSGGKRRHPWIGMDFIPNSDKCIMY